MGKGKYLGLLSAVFLVVLIWSGVRPKDYFTWLMEVAPGIIGFILLAATYKTFRFTDFVYTLILLHSCVLFVGGHYTYAEVPLFDWIKELMNGTRNNYDKVGHFAQGFVPALIARELFLRLNVVNGKKWASFFAITSALAISAFYELVEWWTSVLTGESAEAFLGTQGYVWDTQSDMLWALIGATAAVLLFSGYHDLKMAGLGKRGALSE